MNTSEIITLLTCLITILDKFKGGKPLKKKIGKKLTNIYTILNEIIENGKKILKYLERTKKYTDKKTMALFDLLIEQTYRIEKVNKIIKNKDLKSVLKIHIHKISDIQILLQQKERRIAILKEQIELQKLRFFHPTSLNEYRTWLKLFQRIPQIIPPTKKALIKPLNELNKVKKLNVKLRDLLVEKFDIDDII